MPYRISFSNETDTRRVYRGLERWYEEHLTEYCGNPLKYVHVDGKGWLFLMIMYLQSSKESLRK